MLEPKLLSKYADIAVCLSNSEFEYGLKIIHTRMTKAIESGDLEEQCRLNLFISWIYYSYTYYPLCIQYSMKVLKYRELIDDIIIIQAYLIRSLAHLKQEKYQRVYDAMQECLRLNSRNEDVLKMLEILEMKGFNKVY